MSHKPCSSSPPFASIFVRESKVSPMLAFMLGAFETVVALKMDMIHNRSNLMTVVFVQYAPGAADTPSVMTSSFFS